ncbi:MAG TPA: helix-turn-helix transcriptional regulator [Pyrinomonadaceae bacterium]|nr:helix-turn-helix transcriptional regulator [Pyrinomonadaceae bacterium]
MARKARASSGFGERLVALRQARNLTQVQLAEVIDSTQRAISYYENHAEYPPAPVLADLAQALNVSTDELLGVKTKPKMARAKKVVDTDDPEMRRVWKKFQQLMSLPEKDQRAVIRLVNSLVSSRNNGNA